MWYCATIFYFGNYYHKDPRERAGLAANAIAVSSIPILFVFLDLVSDGTKIADSAPFLSGKAVTEPKPNLVILNSLIYGM